jgi:hypothetical protein
LFGTVCGTLVRHRPAHWTLAFTDLGSPQDNPIEEDPVHRICRHLTYGNALATIALFIALGGGAIAAIHSKSQKSHPRWAVVSANGNLVRGAGAVSAKQLFTNRGTLGSYQVTFKRNVSRCGLVATLGRTNSASFDPRAGEIGVAYRHGSRKSVYVKTRASDGAEANRSFHLAVLC